MERARFATAVNCIDGRVQTPVTDWMKANLDVDYVDMVTQPGPDKALTQQAFEGLQALSRLESIKERVMVSVRAHNSRTVAIVGHHDCAGDPVSKDQHLKQIARSCQVVASWGLPVRVLGLWVNEARQVEVVYGA